MTTITKNYLNNLWLTTGKVGEVEITQVINLLQILTEELLCKLCPHSQFLATAKTATIDICNTTRHLAPKMWQQEVSNGILSGIHNTTKDFFCQILTREQINNVVQLDLSYHHVFISGLGTGNIRQYIYIHHYLNKLRTNNHTLTSPTQIRKTILSAPSYKQKWQHPTQERGIYLHNPRGSKILVSKCFEITKAKKQPFTITNLQNCMVKFQKYLKINSIWCMQCAILGVCKDWACFTTTPANIKKYCIT